MDDQKCNEKIEQEISGQVVIWIKSNPKMSQTEIKNKIIQEITKKNYLKEDWQIHYATERIMIFVKEKPGINFNYAGFWLRVVAFIIDVVVINIISIPFLIIVSLFLDSISLQEYIIRNIIGVGIAWIYYASMESSQTQGTLGKMALGIKVTNLDGDRISFSKATVRFFSKIISSIFCIGYLMIAFTKKEQGLHDKIAGCLVVKKGKKMTEKIEKKNLQKNNPEHDNKSLQKVIQHEEKNIGIKKSKDELILPITILLACIILGGFYYVSQVNKQQSIERQQAAKIEEDKKADYFKKKIECEEYAESIKKEIDRPVFFDKTFEMIFYSPKDNSCLYVINHLRYNGGREYFVYNALTKSKVTSFQLPEQWEDYKNFILEYSGGEIRL